MWKLTPEQKAYRLQRLRESMAVPRDKQWLANQRAGVKKAALLGKYSRKQSPETIEKRVSQFRGKKRPPEVVAKCAEANRGKNSFRKPSAEALAHMSAANKAAWQKERAADRERVRQMGYANRGRKHHRDQNLIHSLMMTDRPRDPEAVIACADKMLGRAQTALLTKKGETHWKARQGMLRSPAGVTYEFRNLTQFVRDHAELFAAEDTVWRSYKRIRKHLGQEYRANSEQCRASKGLSMLFSSSSRHTRQSWKGWTRVFCVDGEKVMT